jgi:hypothetical protein
MARQKGLFKLTGTLDAVNYYVVNGVGYARKAGGGFNADVIRTQPSMQRVRENASEFGHCSQVKKQFRLVLLPFLEGITGKALHSRMMTLFTGIKALDAISERGNRKVGLGIQTAKGQQLVSQFAFTPQHTLLEALKQQAVFDWETQRLQLTDFSFSGYKVPAAATHVALRLGVLDFDFASLTSTLAMAQSPLFELAAGAISFSLQPEQVLPPEHTGIAVLGLRFYEVIDEEAYGLQSMVGLCVLQVLKR